MHENETISEGDETWREHRKKKTYVGIAWVKRQEFA